MGMGPNSFRPDRLVATLNGLRYHVASPSQAQQVGGRQWVRQFDPQQGPPWRDFDWPLLSFHEGAGFSFSIVDSVYEMADGWDAITPGILRTYNRHAVGTAVASADYYGWMRAHGTVAETDDYLYMLRDRYGTKYIPDDTAGATWAIDQTKDFGAANRVAGRPDHFKGALHTPVEVTATRALATGEKLTAVGNPGADTWVSLPASKPARAFKMKRELLFRVDTDGIASVANDSAVETDWSDHGTTPYGVGDPSIPITDLQTFDRYLIVAKKTGVWSFNENLFTTNELPDLEGVIDNLNGFGMNQVQGLMWMPHGAGLIRWAPGQTYQFVGLEQEGGLEGGRTRGWGRVRDVQPYGKYVIVNYEDTVNNEGSIVMLAPPRTGRGPVVPHMIARVTSGHFEGGTIVTFGERPYYCVTKVDTAGTSAEPWIFKLPQASLSPALDPALDHKVVNKSFFTSRYIGSGRDIEKNFRVFEAYLELDPVTTGNGLEVWASIEDGAFFQLLDSAGAALTVKTSGFHRFWFPTTAAAVGGWGQLEYRVPAGANAQDVTVRDGHCRGSEASLSTFIINTVFLLNQGEFSDGNPSRRSPTDQVKELEALLGKRMAFTDPLGDDTGFCTLEALTVIPFTFKNEDEPQYVAQLQLRVQDYG